MSEKIPLFKVYMNPGADAAVRSVLYSGFVGQGPRVEEFERQLTGFLHTSLITTVNSATSGLHLALHMAKKPGLTEVLSTPLTCAATNTSIVQNGLDIRWVDVSHNCNIDVTDLKRKVSPKTAAIMVVHWGGQPADLGGVAEAVDYCYRLHGHRPMVIEDCAHAFGATYGGKKLGNHGNVCVYSFQAIKHLTTVDGGLVVYPNTEMRDRGKLLRWYGLERGGMGARRLDHMAEAGFKFHMNDVAAAIGIANLTTVGDRIYKHRKNAAELSDALRGVPGVELIEPNRDGESSSWLYTLLVENRDRFIMHLDIAGIEASSVHCRNDWLTAFRRFRSPLPTLDEIWNKIVCVPCGWWVGEEQLKHIIETVRRGKWL